MLLTVSTMAQCPQLVWSDEFDGSALDLNPFQSLHNIRTPRQQIPALVRVFLKIVQLGRLTIDEQQFS